MPAAHVAMLVDDRERLGFSIGQVAWRLGISAAKLRRIAACEPIVEYDVWDKFATFYGWPRSFGS
jgi:hypothetical protein